MFKGVAELQPDIVGSTGCGLLDGSIEQSSAISIWLAHITLTFGLRSCDLSVTENGSSSGGLCLHFLSHALAVKHPALPGALIRDRTEDVSIADGTMEFSMPETHSRQRE